MIYNVIKAKFIYLFIVVFKGKTLNIEILPSLNTLFESQIISCNDKLFR